jgi:hypothetical protein
MEVSRIRDEIIPDLQHLSLKEEKNQVRVPVLMRATVNTVEACFRYSKYT